MEEGFISEAEMLVRVSFDQGKEQFERHEMT